MPAFGYVEYQDASPEVKAVYDDIMTTRGVDWISNFWKAMAHDPALLRRTWNTLKEIMQPGGALDPLTKEMIYLAVSASNQCHYCIASHTAASWKAGMNDAMFGELMSIVGMANETNRLVSGYQVEIDERFRVRDEGWKKYASPREVVEKYIDAMSRCSASEVEALLDPEVRAFEGNEPATFAMTRQYIEMLRAAIGGFRVDVQEMHVSGEWVSVITITRGVHIGDFMGVPATGRNFAVRGMAMYRVAKGRIVEAHSQWDVLAFLRQLGAEAPMRLP